MNAEIKILKDFAPKEFVIVCGLPGIAYIGKLSVDYLVQQLKAELVGEDVLFLSGNSQAFSPEGQYEVTERVLDWAVKMGVKKVYSVAALVTERPFEKPDVFVTATSLELLEEAKSKGAQALDHGIIGGENGLILGLAKKKNIDGACLLAETHGYQTPTGEYVLDPHAAKAALNILTNMLNLKVDMEPMEKQAMEMDEAIAKMAEIERRVREEMTQSGKRPSYVT
jgi:proteasome assembly chaperone (PAC2) family protein